MQWTEETHITVRAPSEAPELFQVVLAYCYIYSISYSRDKSRIISRLLRITYSTDNPFLFGIISPAWLFCHEAPFQFCHDYCQTLSFNIILLVQSPVFFFSFLIFPFFFHETQKYPTKAYLTLLAFFCQPWIFSFLIHIFCYRHICSLDKMICFCVVFFFWCISRFHWRFLFLCSIFTRSTVLRFQMMLLSFSYSLAFILF